MLYDHLQSCPTADRHPVLVTFERSASWPQLRSLAEELADRWSPWAGQRVGLVLRPNLESLAALAALDRLHVDAFLLDGRQTESQWVTVARQFRLSQLVVPEAARASEREATRHAASLAAYDADDPLPGTGQSSVTILTSGTEGRPKAVRHSWASLARPVRKQRTQQPPRWALTFQMHLYAGLQVLLQSFLNYGTLVVPGDRATPDEVVTLLRDQQVEFASATPSYWRRLVLFADPTTLARIPLRQLTLGGETADQKILDALRAAFPAARIAHIYATTELGRCFSVTDGLAGFPARWLEQPTPEGVALKIDNGQLLVRSVNAMQGYDTISAAELTRSTNEANAAANPRKDWFATGDLVCHERNRICFAGRKGDLINVGGNKVQPMEVERVIRDVVGVADVRVYGQSSSIAGQLVACDLVVAAGEDPERVRHSVLSACHERLSRFQCPRMVQLVDQIQLSAAGKTQRRVSR